MAFLAKKQRLGAAVLGLLCAGLFTACQPEKPVDPLEGYRVAVVDLQPLMELHPSYSKLKQMDDEIGELQQKKVEIQAVAREKLIKEGGDEMQKAVEKAKAKLEAEKAAVEGEIAALSSSLSARIQGEMRGLQASYEAELKAEIAKIAPPEPVEAPPIDASVEGQVQDYLANLSLVRERNLAAKRLELEKRVGDEIAGRRAEVDGQLAAFEADLAAQYQSERLNLQLKAQNSTDEETKVQSETRLGEIANEINDRKMAKKAELEGGYAALRAEKTAALAGELEAYQRELDAEVQAKLAAKRREIGISAPRPVANTSGPPPEVKAKIASIEARMKAQLESKQAALRGQMEAKMAEAEQRLKKKQAEVEANLKKVEEEITKRMEAGMANLPADIKTQMDEVDGKIEKLTEESKKLYESIRQDIDVQVGGIAKDKKQEMVIGAYRFKDPSFEDLTDLSTVRVQQMEAK